MLLQGLFVPLTCPFYRDGASYLRKLEHNTARYSLGPVAGLLAVPPTGESGALTDAEAVEALEVVGEAAARSKVLLAGVERNSVRAVLAMAEGAAKARFDAVILAPPPDWARLFRGQDARELVLFFQAVADRSPLPLVLWSEGRPPSLQLPLPLVAEMAQHPNVLGLMDADLDVARLQEVLAATAGVQREATVTSIFEAVTGRMLQPEAAPAAITGLVTAEALQSGLPATSAMAVLVAPPTIKTRTRSVGFQVLSAGPAHGLVPLLTAGCSGAMPPLAACAPQACFEAYAAWKDGDRALAEERAARLQPAEELLTQLGPAAVKAGCDFNGYFGGAPRLPRVALPATERAAVETALRGIRN